jgi:hypothetical protein
MLTAMRSPGENYSDAHVGGSGGANKLRTLSRKWQKLGERLAAKSMCGVILFAQHDFSVPTACQPLVESACAPPG